MTPIVTIDTDFSWTIRGYHNYLRRLRSVVFVVYFLRVTLIIFLFDLIQPGIQFGIVGIVTITTFFTRKQT